MTTRTVYGTDRMIPNQHVRALISLYFALLVCDMEND